MSRESKKYLVFGSTGLVGSAFKSLFKPALVTAGRSNCDYFLDLTEKKNIDEVIRIAGADTIINFAAYTNVDEAEKQKGDRRGSTYLLNTQAPIWLAEICRQYNRHLIHISTDYVFDGRQDNRPYLETDPAKPLDSWYSQTKRLGEIGIEKFFMNEKGWAIIRISFPYADYYQRKLDIARTVTDKLKKGQVYHAVIDEKIKPTHVNEISRAVNLVASKAVSGIYHVTGDWPGGFITPYDFAQKVAREHNLDVSLIKPITFKNFVKTKIAPRPQHTWLNTGKIKRLGILC